jgi:pimeloyl-ACP methyl ester carboxylesterase
MSPTICDEVEESTEETELLKSTITTSSSQAPVNKGGVSFAVLTQKSSSLGSFGSFVSGFSNNNGASERSISRQRWNIGLSTVLMIVLTVLLGLAWSVYQEWELPRAKARLIHKKIFEQNAIAAAREVQCHNVTWEQACDVMAASGARRQRRRLSVPGIVEEEDSLLMDEDDVRVMFDTNCLRIYRLTMFGEITFPYHGSQLLTLGGNQTMALFIQHGALRNAPNYFCSFKQLMVQQQYRDFRDILIIAPDFNYGADPLVHPNDAFWNKSKPWGDWRVGAESDPACCGTSGRTVSSYDVLDHMLVLLTDQKLYPRMEKISFVGHSAGGQMIQRYAILSILAALWDFDNSFQVKFIVANPSSYTYLTPNRYPYQCGNCNCTVEQCRCDQGCSTMSDTLAVPSSRGAADHTFPCYTWNYDRWPYGIGSITDAKKGFSIPYSMRNGVIGTARSVRMYKHLHLVYLVGQNDTCNDNLAVCDGDCWKRGDNFDPDLGEWSCFRNDMDTRCPAMLQGPNRRTRGYQYMKYLEWLYGEPTHVLYTIPGVGHNATGIFSSEIGMRELFQ